MAGFREDDCLYIYAFSETKVELFDWIQDIKTFIVRLKNKGKKMAQVSDWVRKGGPSRG